MTEKTEFCKEKTAPPAGKRGDALEKSYAIIAFYDGAVGNVLVATSVETAALLSKKALMRPIGSHNENANAAKMEKLLEDGINAIGLGPQGKGGMGPNTERACKEFGPLIVSIDPDGRNLFEEQKVLYNQRKEQAKQAIYPEVKFIK